MGLKILRYSVLIFASVLWFLGCSPSLLRKLNAAGVLADDYRYGDLYRLSNLPQFKEKLATCSKEFTASTPKLPIDLYVIGDSFTDPERIDENDFLAQNYQRIHWAHTKRIVLDTAQTNVLMLQSVERHFREHLSAPVRNYEVVGPNNLAEPPKQTGFWDVFNRIIPADTEETFESFLFGNDFTLVFKEWKAVLNEYFFGRTNQVVSFSKNKKYIFLGLDTDTTRINSSFTDLANAEVDSLVEQLDRTRKHYSDAGFDAVLLSIVPNKASIVAQTDGQYNHLIERVQANRKLSVDYIDTYGPFSKTKRGLYLKGDSHWSCAGQRVWTEAVNQKLKQKK